MKTARGLGAFLLLFTLSLLCSAQVHDVLCRDGNGSFDVEFRTGVKVSAGPEKSGGFNQRSCQGVLSWGKQKLVVADGVSQFDIDLIGAELNAGEPVVAFAIAQSAADCCMTYKIYSLQTPPRLLRTITGGGYFSAADSDLDGDVEIWTEDAAAVNGFEGVSAGEIEFVPPCVLRMERGRLLDASGEFQPFFDGVIKNVRSNANPDLMQEFKLSDGRLQAKTGLSAEQLVRLSTVRKAKIQVLEIAWAYLYSGREQDAWRTLTEMWPAEDVDRIRGEIVRAREHGIHSQLDGVSSSHRHRKRPAPIYEQKEVTPAQAILMRIYPPAEMIDMTLGKREVHVMLVVDSAGKVQAVTMLGVTEKVEGLVVDSDSKMQGIKPLSEKQKIEQIVQTSVARWKFVPAFKSGRAVTSRMQTAVWLQR